MTLLAPTSIAVLRHISQLGGATRADIERAALVANPAVRLSTLAKQGFIRSDHSGRPVCYHMTGKGDAVLINPTRRSPAKGTGKAAARESLGNRYATPALRAASSHVDPNAYQGAELRPFTGRPGAMDAYSKPSVVNGQPVPRVRPMLIGAKPTPRPEAIGKTT